MYDYALNILRMTREDLHKQQMSLAEDCRDGINTPENTLQKLLQVQGYISDVDDSIAVLESIGQDESEE